MRRLNALEWTALGLLIVGGLNWGLIGLFNFNLVDAIFGAVPIISRIIYTLVGVAAIYMLAVIPSLTNRGTMSEEEKPRMRRAA